MTVAADVHPAIRVHDLAQTFGGTGGVRIPALDIPRGRTTAVVGFSGSGKTTLLHLVSGMREPEGRSGRLTYELVEGGATIRRDPLEDGWAEVRPRLGFVFQDALLIGAASCRHNLDLARASAGLPRDDARIEAVWTHLGLPYEKLDGPARDDLERPARNKLDGPARDLSGGMRQRAALARALVRDPAVLFADEPTANLDYASGDLVMTLLRDWLEESGDRTLVLVTHDLARAAAHADRIVYVTEVDGRSVASEALPNPGSEAAIRAVLNGAAIPSADATVEPATEGALRATTPDSAKPRSEAAVPAAEGSQTPSTGARRRPRIPVGPLWNIGLALARDAGSATLLAKSKLSNVRALIGYATTAFAALLPTAVAVSVMAGYGAEVPGLSDWPPTVGSGTIWLAWFVLYMLTFVVVILTLARRRRLGRLGGAALFRTFLVFGLGCASLVALTAQAVVEQASERRLSSPDLQPLLIGGPFDSDALLALEDELAGAGLLAPGREGAVLFGRHAYYGIQVGVPVEAYAETQPSCEDEAAGRFLPTSLVGIGEEDPFLSRLGPPSASPPLPAGREIFTQDGRVRLDYDLHGGVPLGGEAMILRAFLDELIDERGREPPLWICVQLTPFDVAPFRLVGVLDDIPSFDIREFQVVVSRDAGATATSEQATRHSWSTPYAIAALWLEPDTRSDTLAHVARWAEEGRVRVESGFARTREAMRVADAASVMLAVATAGIMIVAVAVLLANLVQYVDGMRREIAVARAFGATPLHLILLVGFMLLPSFGLAGVMLVLFGLTVLPLETVGALATFGLAPEDAPSFIAPLAAVVVYGAVAGIAAVVLAVQIWLSAGGSVAQQLQEAG